MFIFGFNTRLVAISNVAIFIFIITYCFIYYVGHTGKFVGCAEYIRRGVWLCCANFGAELSKFLALLYWRGVAWPTGVWRGVA